MSLKVREQGRRTRANRLTFDPPVKCPAGIPVFESEEGSGCFCTIERNRLTALRDPSSLQSFCFDNGTRGLSMAESGDYKQCPSWQMQKDWEQKFFGDAADDKSGMIDTSRYRSDLVEQQREVEITTYHHPD